MEIKSNERESSRVLRRVFLSIPPCLSSRVYLVQLYTFSGINIGELTRNDDLRGSLTRTRQVDKVSCSYHCLLCATSFATAMRTYCSTILLSAQPHPYKDTRASLRERIPLFCIPVKSNPDASLPHPVSLQFSSSQQRIRSDFATPVYYVVRRWIELSSGNELLSSFCSCFDETIRKGQS